MIESILFPGENASDGSGNREHLHWKTKTVPLCEEHLD